MALVQWKQISPELKVDGNLTGSLNLTGSVNVIGPISASSFIGDGSQLTGLTIDPSQILPAGTNKQLQFNDNGTLGATSDLYYDKTTSRVGIGTSSPGRSIEVVSSQGTSVGLRLNSTGIGGRSYSFFSTNNLSSLGGGNFGIYDDTVQQSRILLNNVGNVGIGTSSPPAKLTVVGDISGSGNLQIQGNSIIGGDLTVQGRLTAEEFHTKLTSASILYESGSTKFGDTLDDLHQITGSLLTSGSMIMKGNINVIENGELQVNGVNVLDTALAFAIALG